MASVVYWTMSAPNKLAERLQAAGHRCWEALSRSEVAQLSKEHDPDVIIIDSGVSFREEKASATGRVCILLEPETTAEQLVWEIEQLFPQARYVN